MIRSPISPSSVACGATFPLEGEGYCGGMVALRGSSRRFRPHPSLARHLPHPGEGFLRLCKSFLYCFLILPQNRCCL